MSHLASGKDPHACAQSPPAGRPRTTELRTRAHTDSGDPPDTPFEAVCHDADGNAIRANLAPALAKAGISEDVIISQIKAARTVFHVSSADIIDLRDSGVTDKIVNYMIDTAAVDANVPTTSTVVVQQAPPPPPVETVVVAPGPDYVWVGGEWVWNGGWFWRAGYWGNPPYGCTIWVGGRSWHDGRGWHAERGHWR